MRPLGGSGASAAADAGGGEEEGGGVGVGPVRFCGSVGGAVPGGRRPHVPGILQDPRDPPAEAELESCNTLALQHAATHCNI